jgi:hypothetical protein
MGFFVICSGVVLLQLSKSAKDVPDAAVFAGDLDQVRTIAEQEQPESEPKADAIRGAAAIVRRFSTARRNMEISEARRLHEEKLQDLEPIGENEQIEWDGLRRRRTTIGTQRSGRSGNITPFPRFEGTPVPGTPGHQAHPPLGMSHFPTEYDDGHDEERPHAGGFGSSFLGSLRNRTKSTHSPGEHGAPVAQSPMHPVALTEINIPAYQYDGGDNSHYYDDDRPHNLGLPASLQHNTTYEGAGGRHITIVDDHDPRSASRSSHLTAAPTPPPHSTRRQFSFQNVFRKPLSTSNESQGSQHEIKETIHQSRSPIIRKGLAQRKASGGRAGKDATEEERLGLVKGDTRASNEPTDYEEEEEEEYEDDFDAEDKLGGMSMGRTNEMGRDVTDQRGSSSRTRGEKEDEAGVDLRSDEEEFYQQQKQKLDGKRPARKELPPPPPFDDEENGRGTGGAFV